MRKFDSIADIIDYALMREDEAYDFYTDMAGQVKNPDLSRKLLELADAELAHKGKLLAVKEGRTELLEEHGADIEFDDFCLTLDLHSDNNLKDILEFAIGKENEAIRIYKDLSHFFPPGEHRKMFKLLAQEEKKHKQLFEDEYNALFRNG
jgi:rubrerythrin